MNLLHEFLAGAADRTAVIDQERCFSRAQLDQASDAAAAELQRLGIGRGDRVALLMENSWAMVVWLFAAWKAGAVTVAVGAGVKAPRLQFILRDCGVRALIADAALQPVVDEARGAMRGTADLSVVFQPEQSTEAVAGAGRPRDPGLIDQDLAAIIYTSGSSGDPKGAMLTHRNLSNTARAICQYLGNTPDDIVCCVLPLAFSYGLCQILAAACSGHTLLLERSFAYPFDVLKRVDRFRATGLPALPSIFTRLIQMAPYEGLDLGSLRYMTNAAAPLPPAQALKLLELFPRSRFFSMYGQTECTRASYLDPARAASKPGSSGRAIPNCELWLADASGKAVPPGTTGELVVRGSNVMRGYWGQPELTATKLRDGPIPGEKVLYTGDLFRADADGDLWFVARTDDVFKCRGEKVSPREIENVIHELPEVAEAAVVGVDDPVDGMAIKLVIVAKAPLTEQAVRRHCRDRLDSALMPKYVVFTQELPRTESGKLKRRDLAGPAAPGAGESARAG